MEELRSPLNDINEEAMYIVFCKLNKFIFIKKFCISIQNL